MLRSLISGLALLASLPTHAQNGKLRSEYTIIGVGSQACGTFLIDLATGRDIEYRDWLGGYLTAYNAMRGKGRPSRGSEVDGAIRFIQAHCESDRSRPVGGVAHTYLKLKSIPPPVPLDQLKGE